MLSKYKIDHVFDGHIEIAAILKKKKKIVNIIRNIFSNIAIFQWNISTIFSKYFDDAIWDKTLLQ